MVKSYSEKETFKCKIKQEKLSTFTIVLLWSGAEQISKHILIVSSGFCWLQQKQGKCLEMVSIPFAENTIQLWTFGKNAMSFFPAVCKMKIIHMHGYCGCHPETATSCSHHNNVLNVILMLNTVAYLAELQKGKSNFNKRYSEFVLMRLKRTTAVVWSLVWRN